MRRQGFEMQMGSQPLPDDFVTTPVEISSHLSGLLCDTGDAGQNVMLWLHGGAFVLGSSASYRPFAARLAAASGGRVMLPDYRLAPEQPFPAALNDTIAALGWLEAQGHSMDRVAIGGDSAGANLALAAVQARVAEGKPAPAALWLISPYLDLTHSGTSIRTRADRDPFIDSTTMDATAQTYLGETHPADPRASPLFGSMTGLPPALIQVGSEEVLFDDAVRLRDTIQLAGGHPVFQEWAGMIHVWPIFAHAIDEGRWAIAQGGNFLRQIWQTK
jgi:acetyl esterase/lipase